MQGSRVVAVLCGLTAVPWLVWQGNRMEAGQGKSLAEIGELAQWATVEAHDKGVPVYAFGYSYVYGVSPDFLPDVVLQEGNEAPARKIKPKKSWEIKDNLFGSTPGREPRTAANDNQPLLGIHLIDGDVRSCWSSRGQPQPDYEPAWIRIDLPVEALIDRVVLVGHPEGLPRYMDASNMRPGDARVGQAFPRKLEIRTSRDAWHWDTVYKTESYTPQERQRAECDHVHSSSGQTDLDHRVGFAPHVLLLSAQLFDRRSGGVGPRWEERGTGQSGCRC